MTEVIWLDHRSITFGYAKEFARIKEDAMKEDVFVRGYWPTDVQFGAKYMPHLADYEEMHDRVCLFGKMVDSAARHTELQIRRDTRWSLCLLKSTELGKFVAGVLWAVPEYVPHDQLSWIDLICIWLRSKYYAMLEIMSFWRVGNPSVYTNLRGEFAWASQQLGGELTPARMSELQQLPRRMLNHVCYPMDLSYGVRMLMVRTDAHKKGFGQKLLNESRKHISSTAVPPPGIKGPAKIALFAAPTAIGFYQRLGFNIGAQIPNTIPNGEKIIHTYMFENVE